ncbi:MAG TPA: HEAT repeat domain-containing protein [Planctomycetota bacterium]|nr:HEAT repeat domain-containing protein [Planctomycetota bacterium]
MRSCRDRRIPFLLAALLLAPLPLAFGHGGAFRGPNGGVPPGLRPPGDPEPPPPPPSDPGDPGGPSTGDTPDPVPAPPDTGHGTGDGGTPPPPVPPQGGNAGRTRTRSPLTYESWRFWWAYNNDDILSLRRAVEGVVSGTGPFAGWNDRENRRNAQRPTQWEVTNSVLPALLRCINARDHEDVHGGAILAAAKVGTSKLIPLFEEIVWNRHTNDAGERIDYGPQARESAVLALGLLPKLDDASMGIARRILLEAVADDQLRTRERTWAAVALGLREDPDAVMPLLDLLSKRYADDNVPAGIVVGLGLIGDPRARADLEEIFVRASFRGRDVPTRVRPFAGYALGKLGDPAALPAVLKVLGSRRTTAFVARSAAVAAGALADRADAAAKAEAASAILKALRGSLDDTTARNFSLIALGRIGTAPALLALLEEAENGRPESRTFAALGLSTRVFYSDREKGGEGSVPVDPALRRRIVDKLAQISGRLRDAETRAAFLLARGLVKDKSARGELVEIVRRPGDTTLRGFACVALGLLDDPGDEVKDALRLALAERTNVDLRRDAATGLGLLRDAGTVPLLLEQLAAASSFVVQGQLVAAIGAIGDQRALSPLATLLEDRRQAAQVRALAAVGLGLIGDLRPLPPLARISRDYNYRASLPDLDELLLIF